MAYRAVYIWVQGDDDLRFFESVVKPLLVPAYDHIEIRNFACMKKAKLISFLKSIRAMGAEYLLVEDINSAPCISARCAALAKKYEVVTPDRIQIVVREIEAWYLAGLDDASCQALRIRHLAETNSIDKVAFNEALSSNRLSRIPIMIDILRLYSIETALSKNTSLRRFIERHVPHRPEDP